MKPEEFMEFDMEFTHDARKSLERVLVEFPEMRCSAVLRIQAQYDVSLDD